MVSLGVVVPVVPVASLIFSFTAWPARIAESFMLDAALEICCPTVGWVASLNLSLAAVAALSAALAAFSPMLRACCWLVDCMLEGSLDSNLL